MNEEEIDAIESYIENSVPPENVSLNGQYSEDLNNQAKQYILEMCNAYGFAHEVEVLMAGREGSNPYRSDARRVMEYVDAVWNVYVNVMNEIRQTREDTLKPLKIIVHKPTPRKAQTN